MLTTLTAPTSGEAFISGNSIIKDKRKVKELIDVSMQQTAVFDGIIKPLLIVLAYTTAITAAGILVYNAKMKRQ